MRYTPMRYTPREMYTREMYTRKMHAYEMYACEVYAHGCMPMRYTPMRCTPMRCTLMRCTLRLAELGDALNMRSVGASPVLRLLYPGCMFYRFIVHRWCRYDYTSHPPPIVVAPPNY